MPSMKRQGRASGRGSRLPPLQHENRHEFSSDQVSSNCLDLNKKMTAGVEGILTEWISEDRGQKGVILGQLESTSPTSRSNGLEQSQLTMFGDPGGRTGERVIHERATFRSLR